MIAPMTEHMPMRVNIRFIAKNASNEKDVGMIAPPSTPIQFHHLSPLRSDVYNKKAENDCFRKHPHIVRSFDQLDLESRRERCDFQETPTIDFLSPTETTKRQNHSSSRSTVISPFSERQALRSNKKISAVCQAMPLQTTGGFFKGKPPITPFTRLGCFRMHKGKGVELTAKSLRSEKRCFTAEVPHVKPQQHLDRRPASHIPQRTKPQVQLAEVKSQCTNPSLPHHMIVSENRRTGVKYVHKVVTDEFFTSRLPFVPTITTSQYHKSKFQVKQLISRNESIPSIFRIGLSESSQCSNQTSSLTNSTDGIENFQQTLNRRRIDNVAMVALSPFSRNSKINYDVYRYIVAQTKPTNGSK